MIGNNIKRKRINDAFFLQIIAGFFLSEYDILLS